MTNNEYIKQQKSILENEYKKLCSDNIITEEEYNLLMNNIVEMNVADYPAVSIQPESIPEALPVASKECEPKKNSRIAVILLIIAEIITELVGFGFYAFEIMRDFNDDFGWHMEWTFPVLMALIIIVPSLVYILIWFIIRVIQKVEKPWRRPLIVAAIVVGSALALGIIILLIIKANGGGIVFSKNGIETYKDY